MISSQLQKEKFASASDRDKIDETHAGMRLMSVNGMGQGKKKQSESVVEGKDTKSRFRTGANPNARSVYLTPFSKPQHRVMIGEEFGMVNE